MLIVSALSLTGCTMISTLVDTYGGGPSPVVTPTVTPTFPPTGIVELAIGDCLDQMNLEDGINSTEPVVECDSEHDLEVFASLTVDGTAYPSVEDLVSFGSKQCALEFKTFVGLDFGISALDFQYYYPTESSWAKGDRGVDCVIFDPTQRTTGTLADAKR
ncbi:MAG: hypothetical protein F2605_03765 [Actinobacteria bacterium]|nr:hypothetical protein [Actinomycetota bacterium]